MIRVATRLLQGYRLALSGWLAWLTFIFVTQPYGPDGTFGGYGGFACMRALADELHWAMFTGAMAVIGVLGMSGPPSRWRVLSAGILCGTFWTLSFYQACGRLLGTGTGVYLAGGFIAMMLALSEADLYRRYG